tara:strand:+ start:1097 stop:3091 length:1995 start_codon:yes stop_codon:yes gene_type:complete
MKIKAKITPRKQLETEVLEEQLGSFIAKAFGLGAKGSTKIGDEIAKVAPKIAATLTGKSWMALSQLAKSPGAKEKLLDAISKAEKTNAPQLFSHAIAPGKQINFYVKPGGKISTKLTGAEKSLVKQVGGTTFEKLPSLKAQDIAVASGAAAKVNTVARSAQKIKKAKVGDNVVAGIVKKSDDVFEAPLVNAAGKTTGKVKLSAKQVALFNRFKDMFTGFNMYFTRAGKVVRDAKIARDAVLKANPKNIKGANSVFKQTMKQGGVSEKAIKRELRRAKRLSNKFDKLGYHPQLAKGAFGHTRAMFKSKELSFLEKIFGLKRGVLRTLLRDGAGAIKSVFKTALKLFALAAVGLGGILAYNSFYGIGEPAQGDDDIDLEDDPEEAFDTQIRFLRPGKEEKPSSEDIEFSKSIDVISENMNNLTITSRVKIISPESCFLISEQRSQDELDKARKDFEKKAFAPLANQFNQLDFLGPAGITHLFGIIIESDLPALRKAAEISYGEFQEEMAGIYSGARRVDYLMTGLAALDGTTPFFSVLITGLAKVFPSVGVGGFNLEMLDSEKFIKDVRDDMGKLDYNDWKEIITPLTYQIMLEPGTDTPEGFLEKFQLYAGSKLEKLETYYKGETSKDIEKSQEELVSQNTGEDLSDFISKLSTTEIKDFLNSAD